MSRRAAVMQATPAVPAPVLHRFPDLESMSRGAAEEVVRRASAARGRFRLVLSGGTTPRRLYEILATPPARDHLPWGSLELFWGDERAVPPDHPDSNYRMAREAWLARVPIPPSRLHRIQAERPDREAAARLYEEEIARAMGGTPGGPPPSFDLVLLGLGTDAHTASLFPGSEVLRGTDRWVAAPHMAPPGVDRVTLTPRVLNAARAVFFLVAGAGKAEALRAVLEEPFEPERFPAQAVRPAAGPPEWFVDEAACSGLAR